MRSAAHQFLGVSCDLQADVLFMTIDMGPKRWTEANARRVMTLPLRLDRKGAADIFWHRLVAGADADQNSHTPRWPWQKDTPTNAPPQTPDVMSLTTSCRLKLVNSGAASIAQSIPLWSSPATAWSQRFVAFGCVVVSETELRVCSEMAAATAVAFEQCDRHLFPVDQTGHRNQRRCDNVCADHLCEWCHDQCCTARIYCQQ